MPSAWIVLRYDHHDNIDFAFVFDNKDDAQTYFELIDDPRYREPKLVPGKVMK